MKIPVFEEEIISVALQAAAFDVDAGRIDVDVVESDVDVESDDIMDPL